MENLILYCCKYLLTHQNNNSYMGKRYPHFPLMHATQTSEKGHPIQCYNAEESPTISTYAFSTTNRQKRAFNTVLSCKRNTHNFHLCIQHQITKCSNAIHHATTISNLRLCKRRHREGTNGTIYSDFAPIVARSAPVLLHYVLLPAINAPKNP